ncbi:hypothetical protein [Ruegeria atlantica]|uniref:hypothetical protein n=1 Tax=Ruegeria atlantica TaxID=81569 RepID=UPI001481375D|nr:hypothetical protein [Ruegeria atlantica]
MTRHNASKATPVHPPFAKIRQVEVKDGVFVTITVGYRSPDDTEPCLVLYSDQVKGDRYINWKCRDICRMMSLGLEAGLGLDQLSKLLCEPDFETRDIEMVRKFLEVVGTPPDAKANL